MVHEQQQVRSLIWLGLLISIGLLASWCLTFCALASPPPSILGSHRITLKIPSFRGNKIEHLNVEELEDRIFSDTNQHETAKDMDQLLQVYSHLKGAEVNGTSDLELDCSRDFFERTNTLHMLHSRHTTGVVKGLDSFLTRYISRCERILLKNVLVAVSKVTSEQENDLEKLRKSVSESADSTGFSAEHLDRHVPTKNLADALTNLMEEKKLIVDPREPEFKINLIHLYQEICEPIHKGLKELLTQYGLLIGLEHLKDPNEESDSRLISWMSNVRICSIEKLDSLAEEAKELLIEQLGDDRIIPEWLEDH